MGAGSTRRGPAAPAEGPPRLGLATIRERAASVGGRVEWRSGAGGTTVRLAIPVETADEPSRPVMSRRADPAGRIGDRPMRIVLADDHALFRDGLASLLGAWGHEVVGQASDGVEAAELAERVQPDLVLMDVRMPGGSGLDATARIKAACPNTAIVMVTVSEDEDDLFSAIKAGAQGYLLKNLEAAQLRSMIDAVGRGEAAISPATAARIIEEFVRRERLPDAPATDPDRLTERELEVLALVTQGLRNKEIAAELGISENTAKYHLRNILEKLHAQSRTEVAARAVREGLVPAPDEPPGG